MKNTLLLTIISLLTFSTFAQSPDLFSYQAVVRDNAGNVVASSAVSLRFSILQTTATGTAQYVETHNPTTDANGLVSIMIGGGTVSSGTFASIDWANDKYFLKVELDPAGGSSYSNMGTTQLISVPYAKHAQTADSAITEKQVLRISNDTIYLSRGGGFVVIPDSSLLGVKKGGSGVGAGGSADLKDFDNNCRALARLGSGFDIKGFDSDGSGNMYILGTFTTAFEFGGTNYQATTLRQNNVFLAKVDSNFSTQWVKHSNDGYASSANSVHSIVVDQLGNIVLSIRIQSGKSTFNWDGNVISLNGSSSALHGLLLRINSNGSYIWNKAIYPASGYKYLTEFTPSQEVLVTGNFFGKTFIGTDSVQFGNSNKHYGLFKISSNGSSAQLLDSATGTISSGIAVDASGNTFVSLFNAFGTLNFISKSITPSKSGLILKYNSSNSIVNEISDFEEEGDSRLGGRKLEFERGTLVYASRNYRFFIGNTFYSSGGSPFVIKYNSSLIQQNHFVLGITNGGVALGVHIKPNGELVLGSGISGNYIIDDVSYTPLGGSSASASLLLTLDNNLKVVNRVPLQQFLDASGFYVSGSGITTFFASDVAGSFYNKSTKYTPGVYLFKD